jgi:hypothetical protein
MWRCPGDLVGAGWGGGYRGGELCWWCAGWVWWRMDGVTVLHQVRLDESRYPTATLHEAAGQTGAFPCEIKSQVSSFRSWGPALPLTTAAIDRLWIHRALFVARPGEVGVVARSSSPARRPRGSLFH